MTDPADVSVVIASNRGGRHLAEAVASVRDQTVAVREIILVDDGSPEPGLESTARELGVAYVRQRASGVSTARNRGAARASGRWIAFLDDDDVWYPNKVERQLSALDARPEAVAAHSGMRIIDESGHTITEIAGPGGSRSDMIRSGNGFPPICTLLIRRETYLAIGGCDTSLRHAEDLDLALRLLQIGEFARAEGPLVGYRRHSAQVTSDGSANLAAYLGVLRAQIQRAERTGDDEHAALVREHLRATIPGMADWGADELLTHLLRRRWREAARAVGWAVVNTRLATLPALARRTTARVTRKARPASE